MTNLRSYLPGFADIEPGFLYPLFLFSDRNFTVIELASFMTNRSIALVIYIGYG